MTGTAAESHGQRKPSILVVDDSSDNLSLMFGLLRNLYTVKGANNGENGIKVARSVSPPDLILLDIIMPGLTGYDVCKQLKSTPATRDIPIIFLTALTEEAEEYRGLGMGAVDYITKPVSPAIFLARIRTHLENKAAKDFLKDQNALLEREVMVRTREILDTQDATIAALASIVETRDSETGNHVRRTQHYVRALAEQLRSHPNFAGYLTDHQIGILFRSAPLHDIGKVGIPDRILLKPGRLDPDEVEIMKTHTTLGHKAIEDAEQQLGMKVGFLACAKEIARNHHEKWDGSGYPRQLAGEAIPISARLMALADVYDALTSDRVYKRAMSHDQATAIIIEGRGSHFDPNVVDAFLTVSSQYRTIAGRFMN
jgi:putative two-component system response regulator